MIVSLSFEQYHIIGFIVRCPVSLQTLVMLITENVVTNINSHKKQQVQCGNTPCDKKTTSTM